MTLTQTQPLSNTSYNLKPTQNIIPIPTLTETQTPNFYPNHLNPNLTLSSSINQNKIWTLAPNPKTSPKAKHNPNLDLNSNLNPIYP